MLNSKKKFMLQSFQWKKNGRISKRKAKLYDFKKKNGIITSIRGIKHPFTSGIWWNLWLKTIYKYIFTRLNNKKNKSSKWNSKTYSFYSHLPPISQTIKHDKLGVRSKILSWSSTHGCTGYGWPTKSHNHQCGGDLEAILGC